MQLKSQETGEVEPYDHLWLWRVIEFHNNKVRAHWHDVSAQTFFLSLIGLLADLSLNSRHKVHRASTHICRSSHPPAPRTIDRWKNIKSTLRQWQSCRMEIFWFIPFCFTKQIEFKYLIIKSRCAACVEPASFCRQMNLSVSFFFVAFCNVHKASNNWITAAAAAARDTFIAFQETLCLWRAGAYHGAAPPLVRFRLAKL